MQPSRVLFSICLPCITAFNASSLLLFAVVVIVSFVFLLCPLLLLLLLFLPLRRRRYFLPKPLLHVAAAQGFNYITAASSQSRSLTVIFTRLSATMLRFASCLHTNLRPLSLRAMRRLYAAAAAAVAVSVKARLRCSFNIKNNLVNKNRSDTEYGHGFKHCSVAELRRLHGSGRSTRSTRRPMIKV